MLLYKLYKLILYLLVLFSLSDCFSERECWVLFVLCYIYTIALSVFCSLNRDSISACCRCCSVYNMNS